MSQQISTAFVKQFNDNIRTLQQQKGTRLRGCVRNETIRGEEAFFDQLGDVVAVVDEGRHTDTPLTDTPHSRRQVQTQTYRHADMIDDRDKLRTLIDPTSDYARVFAYAFGRAMDDAIVNAAFADAKTGKTGSNTSSFDTDFSIANDFGHDGSDIGLTTKKMVEAGRLLDGAENERDEGYYLATNAYQLSGLVREEVVSSLDDTVVIEFAPATRSNYSDGTGLQTGQINNWVGFNIVRTERIAADATNDFVIAWAKNSLLLAVAKDPETRIDERPDKNYGVQVFMEQDIGATRMDEKGVVQILCDLPA